MGPMTAAGLFVARLRAEQAQGALRGRDAALRSLALTGRGHIRRRAVILGLMSWVRPI